MKQPLKIKSNRIKIHNGFLEASGKRCQLWSFDLADKYAIIVGYSINHNNPIIYLDADKNTIINNTLKKDTESSIEFTALDEHWSFFSAGICKYTLNVCLVRNRK
jgi:hypothetical protein